MSVKALVYSLSLKGMFERLRVGVLEASVDKTVVKSDCVTVPPCKTLNACERMPGAECGLVSTSPICNYNIQLLINKLLLLDIAKHTINLVFNCTIIYITYNVLLWLLLLLLPCMLGWRYSLRQQGQK